MSNTRRGSRNPICRPMPLMLPAGSDGAREAHMIARHLPNGEGWDLNNPVMKILEEQVSEEEKKFTAGEPGDAVSDGIFHFQCLEFLCNQGPYFLMKNLKDKEMICSVLLDMAEPVRVRASTRE